MRLSKRDTIATVLVAVAALLYLLWALGWAPFGLDGTRATGIAVLALGFAASASAVVPTFDQLLHGSRIYLAVSSAIGVLAAAAGVYLLATASEAGLAVVMVAMIAMWVMATVHHRQLTGATVLH
jgi:hypothetical protein